MVPTTCSSIVGHNIPTTTYSRRETTTGSSNAGPGREATTTQNTEVNDMAEEVEFQMISKIRKKDRTKNF